MCLRTYTGCPDCDADYTSVQVVTTRTEYCRSSVTEDGQPTYEDSEYDYSDDHGSHTLECQDCGSEFSTLESEKSHSECDCDACDPDWSNSTPENADEVLCLTRRPVAHAPDIEDDWPAELRILLTERSIDHIFITRERLAEIYDDYVYPAEDYGHVHITSPSEGESFKYPYHQFPVYAELGVPIPDQANPLLEATQC